MYFFYQKTNTISDVLSNFEYLITDLDANILFFLFNILSYFLSQEGQAVLNTEKTEVYKVLKHQKNLKCPAYQQLKW